MHGKRSRSPDLAITDGKYVPRYVQPTKESADGIDPTFDLVQTGQPSVPWDSILLNNMCPPAATLPPLSSQLLGITTQKPYHGNTVPFRDRHHEHL